MRRLPTKRQHFADAFELDESACGLGRATGRTMSREPNMEERERLLQFAYTTKAFPSDWVNPFDKIEELLTCPICLDRYKNPKVLPCQHSFCLEPCLEGLMDSTRRTVKCPECRVEHLAPQDGARGWPTNYTLVGFLEIHLRATEQSVVEFEAYVRRYNMGRCKVCNEKAVLEPCAHCNKKICPDCLTNHSDMIKRDLKRLLTQVKRISCRITDWSETVSRAISGLAVQAEAAKEEVKEWMRRIAKQVKKREEVLMAEVDAFCSTESRIMTSVRQTFELESCNISEACARLDAYLKGDREMTLEEAVYYKQMFLEGLEHLRSFSPDIDGMCNKRFRFAINTSTATLANIIAHFGEIQVSNFLTNISLQNTDIAIPRFLRLALESDANEPNHERPSVNKPREEYVEDKRTATAEEARASGRSRKTCSRFQPSEVYESHRQSERICSDVAEVMANSPWVDVHRIAHALNEGATSSELAAESMSEPCSSNGYSRSRKGEKKTTPLSNQHSDDTDEELNNRIANIRKNFELRKRELDKQVRTIQDQKARSPVCMNEPLTEPDSDDDVSPQDLDDDLDVQPIEVQVFKSVLAPYAPSSPVQRSRLSREPSQEENEPYGELEETGNRRSPDHYVLSRSSMDRKAKRRSWAAQENSRNAEKRQTYRTEDATGHGISRVQNHEVFGGGKQNGQSSLEEDTRNDRSARQAASSTNIQRRPIKRYTYTNNAPKNNYARKGRMILKFGHKGDSPGQFNWPRGLALTPNGKEVVICDSSNHRLQVFDIRGKFLRTFGKYGNGTGQFDSLAGICVNQYGQMIVTDRYNHRIQVLDPSGRTVRIFGSHGQTNGRFNNPWGVTMDLQGFIYVCDKDNHRIQILQADGSYVGKFGDLGSHEGQFQHPHFITSNRHNQLIVSDTNNHRIQVFDHEGQFLFSFGTEGYHEGQFKYPKGVAVDDQEFIFVADSGNSRVQIFYPDGRFFAQFGGWGSGDGELRAIEDIKVTSDGLIIVSDRENHRIQVF
uniref:RING-type domain-containing protein n=1 Tax=Trichuris muris TaxID=70415 RepID=A0A5S6QN72_TRIMR